MKIKPIRPFTNGDLANAMQEIAEGFIREGCEDNPSWHAEICDASTTMIQRFGHNIRVRVDVYPTELWNECHQRNPNVDAVEFDEDDNPIPPMTRKASEILATLRKTNANC